MLNLIKNIAVIGACIAFVACSEKGSSLPSVSPSEDEQSNKTPPQDPSCFIYPEYKVANCNSLIRRSSLRGESKSDYSYPNSSDARYRAPSHLIDLTKIDLNTRVTKNFKLDEFMQIFKGRYGLFAEHVFGYAQQIRDEVKAPLRVTSGYRSPAYNKSIKGATISRHMYGDALDLAGAPLNKLEAACRSAGASFIQLYSDGHIHCDWRSHELDSTFYRTASFSLSARRVADMTDAQFKAMQEDFSGAPIISIEGEVAFGNTINLSAHIEEQEEEGKLLTEWVIVSPSNVKMASSLNPLPFELKERGTYSIYVKLGGYSDTQYNLVVP